MHKENEEEEEIPKQPKQRSMIYLSDHLYKPSELMRQIGGLASKAIKNIMGGSL